MTEPDTKNLSEPKFGYSLKEVVRDSNVGRTKVYSEIKAGKLKARKVGRRTIITDVDYRSWLASLPVREVA